MFKIHKRFNRCRASLMTLPHGDVRTPVYMPVGTKGGMKGLTSENMSDLIDCDIMLSNTYHLFLKPGEEIMEDMGGLHKFENWNRNILTDSGGFQIVSLGELNSLDEEGVSFKSHIDGREFKLTPERSMDIQNKIGSDIMMALDDVVAPTTPVDRVEEAMERSVRWLDRCIKAHKNTDRQNLFGIIQGGVNDDMRRRCCKMMAKRNLNGYAIGGLAGGEDKDDFWRTVKVCTDILPDDKPRYVMGIGYAEDLMICSLLGADMFDCVFATRTARFGSAFSKYGMIKLKKNEFETDFGPISEDCTCYTCQNYTRAYISHTFRHDQSCLHLISLHNVQ